MFNVDNLGMTYRFDLAGNIFRSVALTVNV